MDTKIQIPSEQHIRSELRRIREQIRSGNESEIILWVIGGKLACSQRPLRDHPAFGGRNPLPPEACPLVIEWVERISRMGIRSIICLLETKQHERYYIRGGLNLHQGGLFGYYQSQSFHFRHCPMTDYQRPTASQMQSVLEVFDELPKPILLQCSAAIDRTTPVAAFIAKRRYDDP